MKKRNKKYHPKQKSITALVARYMKPYEFDLPEFITLDAFMRGRATEQSLRNLEDYMNLILIADDQKPTSFSKSLSIELVELTDNVFRRYFKTKSIGLNSTEREKISDLITAYQRYWLAYPSDFYNACLAELTAFYKERSEIRPYKQVNVLGMAA